MSRGGFWEGTRGVTTPIEVLRAKAKAAGRRPLAEDEFGNIGDFVPPFNILPPERLACLHIKGGRRGVRRYPVEVRLEEDAGSIGARITRGFLIASGAGDAG